MQLDITQNFNFDCLSRDGLIEKVLSGIENCELLYFLVKLTNPGWLQVADYIPQLSKQDPNHFGISLCTIDGQRYSLGDSTVPFTLQSCW